LQVSWSDRFPVTEEIAGSSPVKTAFRLCQWIWRWVYEARLVWFDSIQGLFQGAVV
jgi:hypothetical protein